MASLALSSFAHDTESIRHVVICIHRAHRHNFGFFSQANFWLINTSVGNTGLSSSTIGGVEGFGLKSVKATSSEASSTKALYCVRLPVLLLILLQFLLAMTNHIPTYNAGY